MNKEIGYITSFYSGVAKIKGLSHVFLHEILLDEAGNRAGLVIGFNEQYVEVLLFLEHLPLDTPLLRSKEIFSIPVSEGYLMRIINGLGESLDNLPSIAGTMTSTFRRAPQIIDRMPVKQPLSTGIKMIDSTLPLGRGQRELIIGDRKLGKSTIAIDTVINQIFAKDPVYCIYVLIGQKRRQLEDLVTVLSNFNAFTYTCVVAATASDSFASQYMAPFVGCTIAEYFRDQGKDALIVYDDLSKHARIYRDIALLLERAPGREAYPGDIFSQHAGLLERAGKLSKEKGGGSITALPIVETQEGDITSFIPTNIISITDGQIYLERSLFQRGAIPAINVGLSVSRIGSEAQPVPLRDATAGLRLHLSQQRELQKLTQLESTMSTEATIELKRGQILLELLKQNKHICVAWQEQVLLFYAIERGFFDSIPLELVRQFQIYLFQMIRTKYSAVLDLPEDESNTGEIQELLKDLEIDFKKEFVKT